MRTIIQRSVIFFLLITVLIAFAPSLSAFIDMPYQTYTRGLDGKLVQTATAYEVTFVLNANFNNPTDIHIDANGIVYVADAGNRRVFVYNPRTQESWSIGRDVLSDPRGVYVTNNGDIYVADAGTNQIYRFSDEGELIQTYGRPTSQNFGDDAPFLPRRLVVDAARNLYVVSDRGANGIITLRENGDFFGYFGVNTVELSLALYIRRLLMTEEQRERFASLTPRPTTNLAIDRRGIIHTVTMNDYVQPIRKLNFRGNNVLSGDLLVEPNYQDIWVDDDGLIYVISNNTQARGVISVLDAQGNLIFTFANRQPGSLRMGHFDNPRSLAVDESGDIWVLDSGANSIQVFTRTEFGSLVIGAIQAHAQSDFDTSTRLFEEVLRQNNMFALARVNLGRAYFRRGDFETALMNYHIVQHKEGYSDVFWEVRDAWIARNLIWVLIGSAGTFVSVKGYHKHKQKFSWYKRYQAFKARFLQSQTAHELKLFKQMLTRPLDVLYEIKFVQSIRLRTATILYMVYTIIMIVGTYFIRGFMFRGDTTNIVLFFEIITWVLPLLLLGIANHLINSLQSGEAFYRDLYIGIIYACAPIFFFKLPLDVLSNVLTFNEAFIFQLGNVIMWGWAGFNVLLTIKELNNYKVSEWLINLFLTLFTMLIMTVLFLVISVLSSQVINFIQRMVAEVFR